MSTNKINLLNALTWSSGMTTSAKNKRKQFKSQFQEKILDKDKSYPFLGDNLKNRIKNGLPIGEKKLHVPGLEEIGKRRSKLRKDSNA